MPVPVGTFRFNITGALPGGELIVHTLHGFQGPSGGDPGNFVAATDRVALGWDRMFTLARTDSKRKLGAFLGGQTNYSGVMGYRLDAAGRATGQFFSPLNPLTAKGSELNALPNAVAMAVSFGTSLAGRSGKGRLYLGGIDRQTLDQSGRFLPAVTDEVALNFRDFIQFCNNDDGTPGGASVGLGVLSRVQSTLTEIGRVRVGDVPDVQRRRRNGLREVYASREVIS